MGIPPPPPPQRKKKEKKPTKKKEKKRRVTSIFTIGQMKGKKKFKKKLCTFLGRLFVCSD
jgi:hypothetical protein